VAGDGDQLIRRGAQLRDRLDVDPEALAHPAGVVADPLANPLVVRLVVLAEGRAQLEWSDDVDEGMAAHREGRKPTFRGR
jgi:hypothetical protein